MKRALQLIGVLAALWLLLSGHYTPLLLALGLLSCLLVWWLSHRMDLVDHEDHPLHVHPVKLMAYFVWLCFEVVKSNLYVARRIISPELSIQPKVIRVPTSQRTEVGQVIYANSITLTPGTVSINLEGRQIEVHALTRDTADALLEGEMDRRVSAVERPQPGDPPAGRR